MDRDERIAKKIAKGSLVASKIIADHQVLQTMIEQFAHFSPQHLEWLKKATGRAFKPFKPPVSDGPNTIILRYVPAKRLGVSALDDGEQFGVNITYNRGMDLYDIEPWHVHKGENRVSRGKRLEGMMWEDFGRPDLLWGDIVK